MKIKNYITASIITCLAGMILYGYYQGWIVIAYPLNTPMPNAPQSASVPTTKKTVRLTYWDNGRFNTEHTTLLWPDNKATAIYYLINQWLTLLDNEGLLEKKITLQAALVSPSQQEVYLSFDRNPLNQQQSTHAKLMWIEGLLKTIRESKTDITSVRFLVHHQPMIDDHLDFSRAWPITGFLP